MSSGADDGSGQVNTKDGGTNAADKTEQRWKAGPCSLCNKRCCFYCTNCFVPSGAPATVKVPRLRLPLKVTLLFNDKIKKNTGVHARVLAPDDVDLVHYKSKDYSFDPQTDVVVFPSDQATTFDELPAERLCSIKRLVLVDTTWQFANKKVLRDPRIGELQHIKLRKVESHSAYWRYHSEGHHCLSTIECLRLVLNEYQQARNSLVRSRGSAADVSVHSTNFNDLLFFFDLIASRITKRSQFITDKKLPTSLAAKQQLARIKAQNARAGSALKNFTNAKLRFRAVPTNSVKLHDVNPRKRPRPEEAPSVVDTGSTSTSNVQYVVAYDVKGKRTSFFEVTTTGNMDLSSMANSKFWQAVDRCRQPTPAAEKQGGDELRISLKTLAENMQFPLADLRSGALLQVERDRINRVSGLLVRGQAVTSAGSLFLASCSVVAVLRNRRAPS